MIDDPSTIKGVTEIEKYVAPEPFEVKLPLDTSWFSPLASANAAVWNQISWPPPPPPPPAKKTFTNTSNTAKEQCNVTNAEPLSDRERADLAEMLARPADLYRKLVNARAEVAARDERIEKLTEALREAEKEMIDCDYVHASLDGIDAALASPEPQ